MICVTGAGGKVGGALVELLVDTRNAVRLAFNSPGKAEAAQQSGFESVVIDYSDPESLDRAFSGCSKLFLLGPNAVNQDWLEINAVRAAERQGITHVVKLSVLHTEAESYGFGRLHRASERAIETSAMSWTFLRASQFMQNLSTYMAPSICAEDCFYTACGDGKITHLDLRDIARVARLVLFELGHEERIYNLTGPEALTYDEIAAMLSEVLGRHIEHRKLTDEEFRRELENSGTSQKFNDLVVDLDRYFRNGGVSMIHSDIQDITGVEANNIRSFIAEQETHGIWRATP